MTLILRRHCRRRRRGCRNVALRDINRAIYDAVHTYAASASAAAAASRRKKGKKAEGRDEIRVIILFCLRPTKD